MNAPDTATVALRERCRTLLAEGTVQVVVGYGEVLADGGGDVRPVFVTDPEDVGTLVLDRRCRHNLVTYLLRPEIAALGRAAVVAKGCDARTVAVLVQESQLVRGDVHLIGVACDGEGVGASRCRTCPARTPLHADEVVGALAETPPAEAPVAEPIVAEPIVAEPPEGDRYARVEEFLRLTPAERLAHWRSEFARCTRCHACRQVCPLCYCRVCVVDRSRPQTVPTSAHPVGVLEFHLTRAFHLAGRCVGCGACSDACPAGIDLELLNLSMARATEQGFGVRPGLDPGAPPLWGTFAEDDEEAYIR